MNKPPFADFNRAPFIVLWELTRACDLACVHCRAEAVTERVSGELSTEECRALMRHMRQEFGPVLVVLTGGDPLKRPDLLELIRFGADLGLRMTITPAAAGLLTKEILTEIREAGISRVAVSLDGADAPVHDAFRQVPGTFDRTLDSLRWCQELGIESQINSSIGNHNRAQLQGMADIAAWYGCRLWSVFLLVPTGRADCEMLVTAREHEAIYQQLADIAATAPFDVKTTAGQPFYRVQAQRMLEQGLADDVADLTPQRFGLRAPRGVNDGNGVVFIGHDGTVCPSGFLQLSCGNVRQQPLADIYRSQETFVRLRSPTSYDGKCGRCEFRDLCGGSRSRTYGLTGNAFGSDPTCVYVPGRKGAAVTE